jgi:hypothetical protein
MPMMTTPWGRTEHAIGQLVAAERNMSEPAFRDHAHRIITYLERRLDLADEPLYVEDVPEPKEDHERDTDGAAAAA